jgi:CxxC-x17-CxxC domain-containing protein
MPTDRSRKGHDRCCSEKVIDYPRHVGIVAAVFRGRGRFLFQVYTDRSIACADCGQEFTFTAGEQEFYAQRGFTESPKRCPSCRQIRKSQRSRSSDGGGSRDGYSRGYDNGGGGGYSDTSYASGGYGGGSSSGSSSGYSSSGGYSAGGYSSGYSERRPREMFEAVCANCGKTASVPFRPSGSKPVYCSDCFENRR